MSTPKPLTPKQQRFVEEYLVDLNATQAAIRAGYSAKTAEQQGPRLLGYAGVAAAIAEAKAARSERTEITADEVLRHWITIGTADPNELIDLRRLCCRHCWGENHRYQRTPAEMESARAEYARLVTRRAKDEGDVPAFDEMGGDGYDARKDPNPDCPECFGFGIERVFPKDTRYVSPQARLLYAGVKQTKEGLEIKLRDQDGAMTNVAKHLGMFTEHVDVKSGGKPLPPTSIGVVLVRPKDRDV